MSYRGSTGKRASFHGSPGRRASTQETHGYQGQRSPPTPPPNNRSASVGGPTRQSFSLTSPQSQHPTYFDPVSKKRPSVRGNSPAEKRNRQADNRYASNASRAPGELTGALKNGDMDGKPWNTVMSPMSGSGNSTPVQIAPPAPSMTPTTTLPPTPLVASASNDSYPPMLPALAYAYQAGVVSTARRRLDKYSTPVSSISLASLRASQDRKRQITKTESMKMSQMISRTAGSNISLEKLAGLHKPDDETNSIGNDNSGGSSYQKYANDLEVLQKDHDSLKRKVEDLTEQLKIASETKNTNINQQLFNQAQVEEYIQQKLEKFLKGGPAQMQATLEQLHADEEEKQKKQQKQLQLQVDRLKEDFKKSRDLNTTARNLLEKVDTRQATDAKALFERMNNLIQSHEMIYQKHEETVAGQRIDFEKLDGRISSLSQRHDVRLEDLSVEIDSVSRDEKNTYNKCAGFERDIHDVLHFRKEASDQLKALFARVQELEQHSQRQESQTLAVQAHKLDEVEKLVERIKNLEDRQTKQRDLFAQVDSLRKHQDVHTIRIDALEVRSTAHETTHQDYQLGTQTCLDKDNVRINDLVSSVSSLEKAREDLGEAINKRLQGHDTQTSEIKANLMLLKSAHDSYRKTTNTRLDKDSEMIQALAQGLTNLETVHSEHKEQPSTGELDRVTHDVGQLQQFINELHDIIRDQEGDIELMKADAETSRQDLPDLMQTFINVQLGPFKASVAARHKEIDGQLQHVSEHIGRIENTNNGSSFTVIDDKFKAHETVLKTLRENLAQLQANLQDLEQGRVTKHELDSIKQQIIDYKTVCKIGYQNLEHRYENMNTDQIYQQMVQWFQHTYPDQPTIFAKFSETQGRLTLQHESIEDLRKQFYALSKDYETRLTAHRPALIAAPTNKGSSTTPMPEDQAIQAVKQLRDDLSTLDNIVKDHAENSKLLHQGIRQELDTRRDNIYLLNNRLEKVESTSKNQIRKDELHVLEKRVNKVENEQKKFDANSAEHFISYEIQANEMETRLRTMEDERKLLQSRSQQHYSLTTAQGQNVETIAENVSLMDKKLAGFEQSINTQLASLEKDTRGLKARQLLLTSELGAAKVSIKAVNFGQKHPLELPKELQ
ncbi:hypothetical protein B0J11DRAFT_511968 [Dendryphion nanum]|uniref:Uncharacterized protein n=1 Tax=Dendryphion nanum TaxID=256645 RepID=A0A9P9D4A9_9PLEO|nr:hypothetical protein B0J11DRAFT_511968 [Dendryphion nanum]